MDNSIANKIVRRIRTKKRGWVFTPKDFLDLGTRTNIDFVLHQLVKKHMIRRISRGIYDFPAKHPKLGLLSPSTNNILRAISIKTGEIIQTSGAEAANLLGLSTQVPAKPIYLTSGRSRKVNVGNEVIKLKHTRLKPMRGYSDMTSLLIQALLYMGKQHIDNKVLQICKNRLSNAQKKDLLHMASRTPGWLSSIIHKIVA